MTTFTAMTWNVKNLFRVDENTPQAEQHRAISAFPDHRGIRVAFLSKHTIDEQADIVDFPPGPALRIHTLTENGETPLLTRMGCGALHIRVETDGQEVHLITAHLKVKAPILSPPITRLVLTPKAKHNALKSPALPRCGGQRKR